MAGPRSGACLLLLFAASQHLNATLPTAFSLQKPAHPRMDDSSLMEMEEAVSSAAI